MGKETGGEGKGGREGEVKRLAGPMSHCFLCACNDFADGNKFTGFFELSWGKSDATVEFPKYCTTTWSGLLCAL